MVPLICKLSPSLQDAKAAASDTSVNTLATTVSTAHAGATARKAFVLASLDTRELSATQRVRRDGMDPTALSSASA